MPLTPNRNAFSRETRKGVLVAFSLGGPSLDNHLPVHPRMRCADVVIDAWLVERDGFRLALGQRTRGPAVLLQCARVVRNVADVGEAHGGAALDPRASGRKAVLGIIGPVLDPIGARRDWTDWSGNRLWRRRRPQWAELPLERKGPDRIPVGTALHLVAAGRDRDELLAIHLVDDGRGVRTKSGLESE